MHTNASFDCPIGMEDMIKQAIKVGLKEICITDHVDYPVLDDISRWDLGDRLGDTSHMDYIKVLEDGETCEAIRIGFDEYISNYKRLAQAYEGQITVLMGCELGLSYHCRDLINAYAAKYPFDFIIASQHTVTRYDVCFNRTTHFIGKSKREAYATYLGEMIQNVRDYDCFDVLGHIDYIIRYGPYEDREMHVYEFDDMLSELFKMLIHKGKGIEINTSGFRYNLGHAHPSVDILSKYRECGGEIITVGADAHTTKYVGSYLAEAEEMLRAAGFKAYTKYSQRKPEFVSL